MRVLHVAGQLRSSPGILRQMEWEQEASHALGLDWQSLLIRPLGVTNAASPILHELDLGRSGHDLGTWITFRRRYYDYIAAIRPQPDVILLRYNVHDPFQVQFIKRSRNVLTVHHAIEDAEFKALGGRAAGLKSLLERRLGDSALRSVLGICGVTPEILDHERARSNRADVPTFVYPNGRLLDQTRPLDQRDGLRLAFVASEFAPWQGLEDLVESLVASTNEFVLDVVGQLSEAQRLACSQDSRIVVHGLVDSAELSGILSGSSVGIAAMRTDGKALTQACTLKVRDYLAAGVPVVSGHDDVFPDDFPYYRRTGTDIEAILAAAHEWRSVDRVTVREAARPHIDKVELVRRLHGELVAAFASADN